MESLWAEDPPETVLDLCCGTGLMTAELVSRGFTLTGLDASPAMLELAARALGPSIPLVEAVLPQIPLSGPYDAVVSTLDGLNYLKLPDLHATFKGISAILRPGGQFIFDVHTDGMLPFLRTHAHIAGYEKGRRFALQTSIVERTCMTTIEFGTGAEAFTETHTQRIHSSAEIHGALTAAGFVGIDVRAEYTNEPVTPETLRATWTAKTVNTPQH